MIKAVKTSLLVLLLCGGSILQVRAQAGLDEASAEAVRRQANTIQLRKTIDEARTARARGETALAIQKYEAAWTLSQGLSNVDAERREIQGELVPIRLELMHKAQSRGELSEADTQVKNALRIDPTNELARREKKENDQRIADKVGKEPSEKVTKRAEEFRNERIQTSTMVQDARFLIEMGRLDEAEKLLRQATKADPEHRAAFYYLDLIKEQRYAQEARKREISAKDRLVDVEKSWNDPILRELLPSANPFARTNIVQTSPSRQNIYRKLSTIKIEDFVLPAEVPLVEVLKDLNAEIRKRDVGGRGVNIIVSQSADRPNPNAQAQAIDPTTGLPAAAATTADIDVEGFRIKFDPPLRDVTLGQLLDAIVMVAKPPEGAPSTSGIKYSVEDYAIVFSQRAQDNQEQLMSRQFRVNPNTFRQGLEGVSFSSNPFQGIVQSAGGAAGGIGGGGGAGGGLNGQNGQGGGPGGFFTFGGSQQGGGLGGGGGGGGAGQNGQGTGIRFSTTVTNTSSLQTEVRAFFTAAGLDFPTNNVAVGGAVPANFGAAGPGGAANQGKAMFFNDRTGILLVRGTMRDLDIIEKAIQALNVAPPQVSIEAKFAEFSQSDDKGLGFNWFLGNTLLNKGAIGLQGGTAPSYNGQPSIGNPNGTFPNPAISRFRNADGSGDENLTGGFSQAAKTLPTLGTMTGILTEPQFRVALQAIENRQGADLLSAPAVTTVSGRQARISVEETRTIIVGLTVGGLGGGGIGGGVAAPAATP